MTESTRRVLHWLQHLDDAHGLTSSRRTALVPRGSRR